MYLSYIYIGLFGLKNVTIFCKWNKNKKNLHTFYVFCTMNLKQKVVLSIGSNLGNKLSNIETCLHEVEKVFENILEISKCYQSDSWGFKSATFFNCCVLIETYFEPEEILSQIQSIEKKMGRFKYNTEIYEARIIDIDIICVENLIFANEKLQIPHKQMQNRNFVLKPFADLNYNWKHPILNINIKQLLKNCSDDASCEPLNVSIKKNKAKLRNLKYLVVEGNIGAGKTTLASKIASDFRAKLVLERFAENPFLPKFYHDKDRFAFPLEMSFLADRYQQLTEDLSQFDLFSDFVVADYHLFKSLLFAKVTLQEDEFRLYKSVFDIIYKEMPKPDLYVYLYQNTDRLLENIKNRGRIFEQNIKKDYLEKINQGYLSFIKSQSIFKTLIVDVSTLDFVKNPNDYQIILSEIEKNVM